MSGGNDEVVFSSHGGALGGSKARSSGRLGTAHASQSIGLCGLSGTDSHYDIKPTPNTGFIILEFADSNFGAEDQLEVQGFNTTDGSGLAYVDVLVNGPEDNLLKPAAVGHGPGGLGILLATGGPVNLLQFRVGYYDDVGREFETPAVALSAVPTPPTFPLFATGLALMGWLAWRRKSALV